MKIQRENSLWSKKNKKAQVTILIIIGLIIVTTFVLAFFIVREIKIRLGETEDPQNYIAKCVKDSLVKASDLLIKNNGYRNKSDNYILYQAEKVPYICKASEFYKPCVNQEPMFIEHVREELKDLTKEDVKRCFAKLERRLKLLGYDVKTDGRLEYEIKFAKRNIIAEMTKKFVITRNDEKKSFQNFEVSVQSPLYDLVKTAMTIANYESTLCSFDNIKWMKYYPDISIYRFVTSDQTKVYTLKEENTGEELKIAIKTCVLPAGI